MKTSSPDPGQAPSDRSKAWSCLVTNLLVLPGLGSVMARRKAGYLQMALALAGSIISFVAGIRIAMAWVRDFLLPNDPSLYRTFIIGIAVFLLGWFWSLLTSLTLFRPKP